MLYRQLLFKEYDIIHNLSHPNIVPCKDFVQHPEFGDCIIMDFIQGQNLRSFINNSKLLSGKQYFSIVKRIAFQLAEAIVYFHSFQIVHRDLKPENIMITDNGHNVKVIDFGLSDTDSYLVLKQPAGTLRYMAPELLNDEIRSDSRSDIYSYGAILLELFSDPRFGLKARPYLRLARQCMLPITNRIQKADEIVSQIKGLEQGVSKQRLTVYFIICLLALSLCLTFFLRNQNTALLRGTDIPLAEIDSITLGFSPEDKQAFSMALMEFETKVRPQLQLPIQQTLEQRDDFLHAFTPDSLLEISAVDFSLENPKGFCRRLRDEMTFLGDMSTLSADYFEASIDPDTQIDSLQSSLVFMISSIYHNDFDFKPVFKNSELFYYRLAAIYFPDQHLPLIDDQQNQYILLSMVPDINRREQLSSACQGDVKAMLMELRRRYSAFSQWSLPEYAWFLTHYFPISQNNLQY